MPRATAAKRPKGYHIVTPMISVMDAKRALTFYKKVFGATILHLHDEPDGTISNAVVRIGNSPLMISDSPPHMQGNTPSKVGREVPRI